MGEKIQGIPPPQATGTYTSNTGKLARGHPSVNELEEPTIDRAVIPTREKVAIVAGQGLLGKVAQHRTFPVGFGFQFIKLIFCISNWKPNDSRGRSVEGHRYAAER